LVVQSLVQIDILAQIVRVAQILCGSLTTD